MKRMTKMTSGIIACAFAILVAVMVKPVDVKAAEFKEVPIYEVSDMRNFDQTIGLTWEMKWNINKSEGVTEQQEYAKFTLKKESFVRIKLFTIDEKAFACNETFRLYANSAMASPVVENDIRYGTGDVYVKLAAGTYYMECGTKRYMYDSTHTTKVIIGAVAIDSAFKVEQIANADGTAVTVKVSQSFAEAMRKSLWYEGKITSVGSSTYGDPELDPATGSFTATKNGWYTVYYRTSDSKVDYYLYINVTAIREGAKKGVTYKSGNLKYKLVKAGYNGKGTVAVTGMVKNKSSVTIPETVNINGHDYKIVRIEKKAFYNKGKLKKIKIKSKSITKIGKNAFKGIKKNAKISVPKSKYKKYKKLITSKTGFNKKTMKFSK